MNVLIANSNEEKSKELSSIIELCNDSTTVIGNPTTLEDTLRCMQEQNGGIDLAFIETSIGKDAVFDSVFNPSSLIKPVIFTSSRKKDAFEAIKSNCIDFLLEPFKSNEVSDAINKVKRCKDQKCSVKRSDYKQRFLVKFGDKLQYKTADEISYIYAEGKTAYLVTSSTNRKFIIEHTLDELEKRHLDPVKFHRINRKFIVNINAIDEARNFANSRLKLVLNPPTEFDMVVSREKVAEFKNWLNL